MAAFNCKGPRLGFRERGVFPLQSRWRASNICWTAIRITTVFNRHSACDTVKSNTKQFSKTCLYLLRLLTSHHNLKSSPIIDVNTIISMLHNDFLFSYILMLCPYDFSNCACFLSAFVIKKLRAKNVLYYPPGSSYDLQTITLEIIHLRESFKMEPKYLF